MVRLSHSKINMFKQCELKYYYRYIRRIPVKQWDHFDLGTFIHSVLENFYKLWQKAPTEDLGKLMSTAFKDSKQLLAQYAPVTYAEAQIYLKSYLEQLVKESTTIQTNIGQETEFIFNIQDFEVEGKIDRIDKLEENVYEIIDYKTTKNESYLFRDKLQLGIYGCAATKIFGPDIEIHGSYYMLRTQKKISFPITKTVMRESLKEIIEIGNKIINATNKEVWKPCPTPLCNYCDFKIDCPCTAKQNKKVFGKVS